MQFDAEGRGFSFRRDEPLDMRMDQSRGPTRGATCCATSTRRTLADVIFQFGEERFSRRIARAHRRRARGERRSTRPGSWRAIVRRAVPQQGYQRIDPATRTFQALRIWVNRELDGLDAFLGGAARRLLAGRAARGHHVSLARGPHREAHVPGAGAAGEAALRIADEAAAEPGRRRSGAQPAGAQREAARD